MRRNGFIGLLLVVLFLTPLVVPSTDQKGSIDSDAILNQYGGGSNVAQDDQLNTGTGQPLSVILNGIISNVGEGTMQVSSDSPGVSTVTLEDGWTGSNLGADIESLTWTVANVLNNGYLNSYHNEFFLVTSSADENDDLVLVPDGWTMIKDVIDDDPHPQHGVYEIDSDPNGYDGTYGLYLEAEMSSSYDANSNDEMYISQVVSIPYRELYSAQISFRYGVGSSSTMDDRVHLFVRFAGYTAKLHVFESGDTTDTWFSTSLTIPASSMTGLSTHALQFDIGLATDQSTTQTSTNYYAIIDEVNLDLVIRPFPEQVDLKANGTLIWGSTSYSTYPYVPDNDARDCYDPPGLALDLNGYGNDGGLGVGIYDSSGMYAVSKFQTGLQFPLDIPSGAIVTNAYLEVEAYPGSSPSLAGMRLYVANEDTLSSFTPTDSSQELETEYEWLPTSIDWTLNSWVTNIQTRYRSPEIGPLVQQVISRSGWSSGNYIGIMLDLMHTSSYSYQQWNDIKGTAGFDNNNRARLYVEYIVSETEDHIVFYDYRKTITIDHTKVAATLTDFPVLIDILDSDLKDHVLSGGNDITFTLNGQSLDHEIELFDQEYSPTQAHLVAWVKVPSLSNTVDTQITMHYGCEGVPSKISGVWDDYEIVQHLNENPTGIQYDSASSNHHGTSYGTMTSDDLVLGKIGNAIDFDGVDDSISVGQIDTDDWSQFTMSAWIYHDVAADDRIFSKAPSTSVSTCIMHLAVSPANVLRVRLSTDGTGGSSATSLDSSATASVLNWHLLTWTWDASLATVRLYVDGQPDNTFSKDGDTVANSDIMFIIANWETSTSDTRHYDGKIDEIRMLPSLRSASWILTEWNNQNNPSTFCSVGSESENPTTWSDAGDVNLSFTTDSSSPITLGINLTLDASGTGQTLDENLEPGTSYYIESGSTIVNWTAKVMVSPPAGATSFGFSVKYPMTEWKPTSVLNPFNQLKSDPQDWWYQAGTLTINSSAIDFWGIWTLKFISWNYVQNLLLGKAGETLSTTAIFNIGDTMKFLATTPTVYGATAGIVLTDPTGSVWYSGSNTTTTDPTHKFPSFQYRKDFTINSANVYADVVDFPVALDFTDSDLHNPSKVRSDGSDIMFAMGSIILPHQIEYFKQDYTISDARLVAWVRANLSASSTTTISMYYGSPLVDNLENPEGVWSSGYEAVWHLGEDVVDEGTTGVHIDATGNGNDGTQHGNVETLTSRVGYAQNFDGNDYISIVDSLTPPDNAMITGWFRIASTHSPTSPTTKVIMEKYLDSDYNMAIALVGTDYGHSTVPNGSLVFKVESSTDGAIYKWTSRTTWNAGWYYFGCFANESDPSDNQIFIGYSTAGWDTAIGQSGSPTIANVSYIEEWQIGGGDYDSGSTGQGWFTGILDEFRVATDYRSTGWLQTEWRNQAAPSTFAAKGSEQSRTSPQHTFTQALTSSAVAGVWTASVYYNDTGTSVSIGTGLYERTFTVKRNTYLTLTKPSDAVGDRLTVKNAGDSMTVEYELKDSLNSQPVNGATVTINWTSPSIITLDAYGSGRYGKVLDTDDLADAKKWRIEVDSTHPYYNDASEYFEIDLYHTSMLDYSDVSTTPTGFDFTATLTFTDTYTGAPLSGATITFGNGTPVTYDDEGGGQYSISIPTSALSLGNHIYVLNATVAGSNIHVASVTVNFTLRAHYTSVSVSGDFETPYGLNTGATVVLIDLDTGLSVGISAVTSFSFTTDSYDPDNFGSLSSFVVTLTTNDWAIGTETVTLTVIMASSNFFTPATFQFDIEITAHRTALTVSGVVTQPYGNQTPLTFVLTDLETGTSVPIGAVSNFHLTWLGGYTDHPGGSYDYTLDTSAWPVGTRLVQVTTTMSSSTYSAPSTYSFYITIRKLTIVLYHDPARLIFPTGDDFTIDLRVNISEPGIYFGDPISGLTQGQFSVGSYPISIDTSEQGIGRYALTITYADLGGGDVFTITVRLTPTNPIYASTTLIITFRYQNAQSSLSSPNYPQVTTPIGFDVMLILNYTDEDRGIGIAGATVVSADHPEYIANWTDLTGGMYRVWIDVTGLNKGTYYFNLTVDKAGYQARTLTFRLVVRIAYTTAIPSVGSLDIPIGSTRIFYLDYTDIDRNVPIDNSSIPYTLLESPDWSNFSVVYLTGAQRYQITFYTSDSDSLVQNYVVHFIVSKGGNYQNGTFSISVSIRTHNTDFRLVSSVQPTSTIGTFNISVYYGDLDDSVGINSTLVVFSVHNATGLVTSYRIFGSSDGFYTIQVPASQFGLGLQTFTVYADWQGTVLKYQDKSLITSGNVVGQESSLTLLSGSEPTAYLGNMSYLFFYSDYFSGTGISNDSGYVFIYVSFQGESVDLGLVDIIAISGQDGNYSIQFNTSIFSRTGLIYMDISVNWAKGIAPYYSNRTDVISVRVLQRDTLLQTTPPSPTSYGENATLTFTYEDITGGSSIPIDDDSALSVVLSLSEYMVTFNSTTHIYAVFFNTSQFGTTLGSHSFTLSVSWTGSPFYASRIGKLVSITVIPRDTFTEYLTPTPTQYMDTVIFNVTWTDITGISSDPITSATLILYNGVTPIDGGKYSTDEVEPGVYRVTLNTTFAPNPGTYQLRVSLNAGVTYYTPVSIAREFIIRYRITLLSAEPIADVPFNSSIEVILNFQDLFTSDYIANVSADGYPVTFEFLSGSNWIFDVAWNPTFEYYELSIETYNQAFTINTPYLLTLRMSYASQSPFYAADSVIVEFSLRIRESTLSQTVDPETTPYGDNAQFTVFFGDDDAGGAGISNAQIVILNNSVPLIENTHYTLTIGSTGEYIITVDTEYLGGLGTRSLAIHANWILGSPYHDNATRTVNILVRQRETNVEVTIPPSQTNYLDDVSFTFIYTDLDASVPITSITTANVHLYFGNGTPILIGFTVTQIASSFEVVISSTTLADEPVSGLTLRVTVDWLDSQAPFYKDDTTTLKVTIIGRTMLVETGQIDRTPKGDTLTIIIELTDADNGNPVNGAIILFDCQNESFVQGTNFDISELSGTYTITVYTGSFPGTGIFLFDVSVHWNPILSPFYSNKTTITLNGFIDVMRTSLQAGSPVPSSVQITGTVYLIVTYSDLDHAQAGITSALITVQYYTSGLVPAGLAITAVSGHPGQYNISFSTSDLVTIGSYTLRIRAQKTDYVQSETTPSFSVTLINTNLIPDESSITLNWLSLAHVVVTFENLLTGSGTTGATVTYSVLGLPVTGMTPTGVPGRYEAWIDTTNVGAGTRIVTIQASKAQHVTAITTVTLVILTLPSEMTITDPTDEVFDVARGDSVTINVTLTDVFHSTPVPNNLINSVYITFRGQTYPCSLIPLTNTWRGTVPGSATILDPSSYDVRITAQITNYDPAVSQFKLLIQQTRTKMGIIYEDDPLFDSENPRIESVYAELIVIRVNFTAPALGDYPITDGYVFWYEGRWELNISFIHIGGGIWELQFNTTQGAFGTWGISFRGIPYNATLAETLVSMTLTIKKITTEVISPVTTESYDWGWIGNISFFYNDTWFNRGIDNASVTYDYGPFTNLPAYDMGNGTYLILINTTTLTSDARHRIIVNFAKDNFEERTSGINIIVDVRPTELIVISESHNQINGDPTDLQIPMGDSFNVTFFYNDTSPIGGLTGGITAAMIGSNTLFAGTSFGGQRNFSLINLGGGYYIFFFDTTDASLYEYSDGVPYTLGVRFFFTVSLELENRESQEVTIIIAVIDIPTELIILNERPVWNFVNGESLTIELQYWDTWHDVGISGVYFSANASRGAPFSVVAQIGTSPGQYLIVISAEGIKFSPGSGTVTFILGSGFYTLSEEAIIIEMELNSGDILVVNTIQIGLPIVLVILILGFAYVRVWSVPKRLRQINSQIKALRKGRVPKPVTEAKSRQTLIAELFNDTFEKVEIVRTAEEMPEESIPIEVPEMGELLMQLAILTHLDADELEDFKADISKMKMSEQAAFVKEVIMQEAIRAARRDGKTIEETMEEVEKQASKLIGTDVAETDVSEEKETVETVFLAPEEERDEIIAPEEDVTKPSRDSFEEVRDTTSERMSAHEIEELRKDLERKGVPPYEIDTIIEQARELPRELVEELVKSLEENKK